MGSRNTGAAFNDHFANPNDQKHKAIYRLMPRTFICKYGGL